MADKNIHRMDSSDSDTADSERNRQSMFNAVLVKRKKGNEEDRCSQVKVFLDEGVDVNALDTNHNTVLHIAVKKGFGIVVEFLLEKGALTDIKNTQGDTAITLAEKLGKQEIARILKNTDKSLHEPLPGSSKDQPRNENKKDISQLKRSGQSTSNAVPVKWKKGNEEDRCSQVAPMLALAHEPQSTSCSGFEENSSTEDQPRSKKPRWDTIELRPGRGLKDNLHGDIYQLKHLVLTLYHAWQKGYHFRLATELASAEKFDDVVIEYEDSKESRLHRFVQLKHRQDESKQITANDLLKKDTDFSVLKYFTSWCKIKIHQDFAASKSKCFILCTNIGLNESTIKDEQFKVTLVTDFDEFLKITDTEEQGSCYKLRADRNTKLYNKLKSESEVHKLAIALAKCVNVDSNEISLQGIHKKYYTALAREVLDVDIGKRSRKFTDAFIRNNGLSPRAEKFRKIFFMYLQEFSSNKNSSETDISTYLEKKSFTPCESSDKSTTGSHQNKFDDLPNDHITDFLDEFILAVNQPNELKLGEAIKRVFGESSSFNLSNTDFIGNSFQIIILDWFKAKYSKHFERENMEEFFEEMEHKISSLIAVGMTYSPKLKVCNVQFNCEVEGLRIFLDTRNSTENLIWQVISFEQTKLTALRIYQTLEQMEEYKKDDSFIFIKLKEFLLPKITSQVFLAFLSSGSQHLLAIDCGLDSTEQDMKQLRKNINEIMTKLHEGKITGKRIILILPEKAGRDTQMEQHFKPIYEKEDDISIDNIEKATQQRLLSKKVIRLQGRAHKNSFFELFGIDNFDDVVEEKLEEYRQVMSPKTLVRLIHGEELRIGEKSEGLCEIAKYYIPRTIDTRVVIDYRILVDSEITDTFAIGSIVPEALEELLKKEKRLGNHLAKYVFLEEGQETEQFNSLCRENDNLSIHWLQREHDEFIWMRSSGNITNLLGYRKETRCASGHNHESGSIPVSEDQLAEYDEERKIVILSDTAGMGKSTVLTCLAEKIRENDSCLLVIKIDLTGRTSALFAEKEKRSFCSNDFKGAVDFLVDKLISNPKPEDVSFFKTIIKVQRKVAILFDGFDEISPDYQETVIDLLQALAKLGVQQLFVTTRPHTSRALEEKLGVFSYTLLPFSLANQIEFLTQFWENSDSCSTENRDDLQEHARNVIDLLTNSIDPSMKEFTGVPLQTRIVADVFPFKESSVPKTITIIQMYSEFVKKKYKVYRQEKKRADHTKLAEKLSSKYEDNWFSMMHQRLALNVLFHKTTVDKLLSMEGNDSDETLEDMIEVGQQTGIVTRQGEREYSFIHRTFAEYFAAIFLTERLRNDGCDREVQEFFVGQLFVQPEYRVIRAFSNCLLVDKNAPLERESWIFEMSKHRNPGGFTAYHMAAEERHAGIVKFLLNKVREPRGVRFLNINCPSTGIPRGSPLSFAVRIADNFDVVKCLLDAGAEDQRPNLDRDGRTALHIAAITGNVKVVDYLIEKRGGINSRSRIGTVPLHDAAHFGNLNMVEYLLDNGADINSQDECGKTPFYHATENGKTDLAKYLVKRGAAIASQGKDGKTFPHHAARFGNLDLVKYLEERGVDIIHSQDEDGKTPLHHAIRSGNIDLVKYLVKRGEEIDSLGESGIAEEKKMKNIDTQDNDGKTPLHYSTQYGNLDMVKYLAERGTDLRSQDKDSMTPLHHATTWCSRLDLDMAECLVDRGADIHAQDKDGKTPLHCAARHVNLRIVNYLADKGADIHFQDKYGKTPFHYAYRINNPHVVKCFVDRGVDINSQDEDGKTPLHYATQYGVLDLIKYLVDRGADIHSQDKHGKRPLDYATQFGNLDLVKYLEDREADIHFRNKYGVTPLHNAADSSNRGMVKYSVNEEADSHFQGKDGKTPLHYATQYGFLDVTKYLADKGADINSQDKDGKTPLDYATQSGNLDLVKYLEDRVADIHSRNKYDVTPLHNAAGPSNRGMVKYLVNEGADSHFQGEDGETPLHHATQSGDLYLVKYLVERGADINSKTTNGELPLHHAAQSGNLDLVKYLADKGADIHFQSEDGRTPLHYATQSGNPDLVQYLAERGADIHSQDKDGKTTLHYATRSRNPDVVKYLVERGADIHFRNKYGETPLHHAAQSGNLNMVKYLADREADIKFQDEYGTTLLHHATQSGNLYLVKYLMERGADINSRDKDGKTPLHHATRSRNPDVVKYLADRVGDIHARNIYGETPLHNAAGYGNRDMVKYLADKGADIHSQDKYGKTPLLHATQSGNLYLVKYLEDRAADTHSQSCND